MVYEFVVHVHPHPQICFGGFMAFTVDKIPDIIKVNNWLTNLLSPDMAIIVGVGAPANQVSRSKVNASNSCSP